VTGMWAAVPRIVYLVACFVTGTFMGSFVGVLTYRIPRDEQWVTGHSVCPACGHQLGVMDLVPVWSYLFLRGRCRYCHARIGVRYLWTEIFTGLLFAGIGLGLGWSVDALKFAIMTVLAVAAGILDFETGLVPDALVLPGAAIGLAFGGLAGWNGLVGAAAGAAIGAGLFALIIVFSKGGMGWGDATLGLMLGSFLGWRLAIVFLMLAFIIGAVAGVVLMVFFKKKGKDAMPFGPAMAAGAYVAALAGKNLTTWYLATLFHR
jgi:leader peptidase (prepilin peptidase)/N-methyltransferase